MYSGMPFGQGVVAEHLVRKANELTGMEASAVGVEVLQELLGGDSGVEGARVAEVAVPDFVDGVSDKLGHRTFSGFVGGVVLF